MQKYTEGNNTCTGIKIYTILEQQQCKWIQNNSKKQEQVYKKDMFKIYKMIKAKFSFKCPASHEKGHETGWHTETFIQSAGAGTRDMQACNHLQRTGLCWMEDEMQIHWVGLVEAAISGSWSDIPDFATHHLLFSSVMPWVHLPRGTPCTPQFCVLEHCWKHRKSISKKS